MSPTLSFQQDEYNHSAAVFGYISIKAEACGPHLNRFLSGSPSKNARGRGRTHRTSQIIKTLWIVFNSEWEEERRGGGGVSRVLRRLTTRIIVLHTTKRRRRDASSSDLRRKWKVLGVEFEVLRLLSASV